MYFIHIYVIDKSLNKGYISIQKLHLTSIGIIITKMKWLFLFIGIFIDG